MPLEVFTNDSTTTVSSGGTTAPASGTTETWTVASSVSFPAASNTATPPTQFHVADPALPAELIAVTNVSGTTWTVTRGAESTTPVAHTAGFTVNQVVSAGFLGDTPQWYNVRSALYGARGNNSTDDTTSIQAAINACSAAGGGLVYIPECTYKLSSALSVAGSGVTIQGAGSGSTILNQTSTTANGITIAATTLASVKVAGLRVNGPNSGSGVGISAAANSGANPVVQMTLEDLIVYQFGSHGLALQNTIVSTLTCIQSVNNLGRGFYLNNGTSTQLINCYANTNPNERGYYLVSLLYSGLTGCAADGNAIGYEANGCDSFTFVNCGAEDTAAGTSGLDGSSFKVNACSNTAVIGCRALSNAAVGAYFTGNSGECSLDGFTETAAGGATASVKVDAGSGVTVRNYDTATGQTLASGTTTILNSFGYTFLRTLEVGNPAIFDSGTDTSVTATKSSPSFSSGVAAQLSTTQDAILYIAVQTSAALAVAIGPDNTTADVICPSKSYALSLLTFRIPKGWWVKVTGTIADLTITQVTC